MTELTDLEEHTAPPGRELGARDLMILDAALAALREKIRAKLEGMSAHTWEHDGGTLNIRTAAGSLTTRVTHTRLAVADEDALATWMATNMPTEVVSVFRIRNKNWLTQWLEEVAAMVATGAVEAPPGTQLVEGGTRGGISVEIARPYKRAAAELAGEMIGLGGLYLRVGDLGSQVERRALRIQSES